jgi:hypothetical protein
MEAKLIDIVGKLVNRATSESIEESEAAARGALARLARSGETFEAYLEAVDPKAVFQSGLMRVADRYAFGKAELSEPAKRDLYASLVKSISEKYSGQPAEAGASARFEEKEEELRRREAELDERERNAEERESRRHAQENPPPGTGGEFSFSPARRRQLPAALAIWKTDPKEALRIYASGILFGAFASVVTTIAAAFGFAWYGDVPDPLREFPVLVLIGGLVAPFGFLRVCAEFHPALREIFQRFP